VSPRMAEMRADMGKAASDLTTMQTFDGPGPETINGEHMRHCRRLVACRTTSLPVNKLWNSNPTETCCQHQWCVPDTWEAVDNKCSSVYHRFFLSTCPFCCVSRLRAVWQRLLL
jgi:hypothetical protein